MCALVRSAIHVPFAQQRELQYVWEAAGSARMRDNEEQYL